MVAEIPGEASRHNMNRLMVNAISSPDNPFQPPNGLRYLWTVSEDNDWLVLYLFFRCYGWKDIDFNDVRSQILVPSATKRYRNLSKDEELKMKDRIISVSKELINLIKELPLTLTGLKMFLSSIHLARGMHQTRKEIALHAVEWLTFGLQTDGGGVKAKTGFQSANKNSLTQPFLPEDSTPESMFMTVKNCLNKLAVWLYLQHYADRLHNVKLVLSKLGVDHSCVTISTERRYS
ncbi:unnamed protein product [Heterobilharzia americana]|nr:unnamed protein product [Heterobilharzia americana]